MDPGCGFISASTLVAKENRCRLDCSWATRMQTPEILTGTSCRFRTICTNLTNVQHIMSVLLIARIAIFDPKLRYEGDARHVVVRLRMRRRGYPEPEH